MQQDTKRATRPDARDLIAHSHRTKGSAPTTRHIAVFLYPDCIREFDGQGWTVKALPQEAA